MADNPYQSPAEVARSRQEHERRRSVWLYWVLGVLGLLILIAMLLPARRGSREAARRSACVNNLKQIAVALHQYASDHGELPPAYTTDANGKPLHSWRTLILPYLEYKDLYQSIDLTKPWDDPKNKGAFETAVRAYQCPSAALADTHTTYFAVVGEYACFHPSKPRKLNEITDDHDWTAMVVEGEMERSVPWMSPMDAVDPKFSIEAGLGRPHTSGANVAFVSGIVRRIHAETGGEQWRALISIAGNDDQAIRSLKNE